MNPHPPIRLILALAVLTIITVAAHTFPVNAITIGFAYLLLVLVVASTLGFIEALVLSIAATLAFNFFFFPAGRHLQYCGSSKLGIFVYISYYFSYCQPPVRESQEEGFGCY